MKSIAPLCTDNFLHTCSFENRPITANKQRRAWIVPGWVTFDDSDLGRLTFRPKPRTIKFHLTGFEYSMASFCNNTNTDTKTFSLFGSEI